MLAAGLAIRLVLAFSTYGVRFDIDSLALVRDQLAADPLHLYDALTVQLGDHISPRWPYPPGFFAWVAPAGWLADQTGLPFHGLIQIPAILADLALALLVSYYLGLRRAADRTRLAAAGLIALGPSFVRSRAITANSTRSRSCPRSGRSCSGSAAARPAHGPPAP